MNSTHNLLFCALKKLIAEINLNSKNENKDPKMSIYEDDNFDNIFRNDVNDKFINLDRLRFFRMYPTRWHSGKVPFNYFYML